eukprot:9271-Heterococcus_DN1.PRE.2
MRKGKTSGISNQQCVHTIVAVNCCDSRLGDDHILLLPYGLLARSMGNPARATSAVWTGDHSKPRTDKRACPRDTAQP